MYSDGAIYACVGAFVSLPFFILGIFGASINEHKTLGIYSTFCALWGLIQILFILLLLGVLPWTKEEMIIGRSGEAFQTWLNATSTGSPQPLHMYYVERKMDALIPVSYTHLTLPTIA